MDDSKVNDGLRKDWIWKVMRQSLLIIVKGIT